MARYVYSPFYPVTDRCEISHRAGWALYWAQELGAQLLTTSTMHQIADVKTTDEVYIYHGMEFKDTLNLQSGLTPELADRVKLFMDLQASTRGECDQPRSINAYLQRPRAKRAPTIADLAKAGRRLGYETVLNPSVSAAQSWSPGLRGQPRAIALSSRCCDQPPRRVDLHGALSRGLDQLIQATPFTPKNLKKLTLYLGNIDLRHHWCRQPDPLGVVRGLGGRFENSANQPASALSQVRDH